MALVLLAASACGDDDAHTAGAVLGDGGQDGGDAAQSPRDPKRPGSGEDVDGGSGADGGSLRDAGGSARDAGDDAGGPLDGATPDAADAASGADADACTGLSLCSGECVNTASDNRHCGACDTPCSAEQSCQSGECRPQWGLPERAPVSGCGFADAPPDLVSQTGCYANVPARTPAAGLIPYAVSSSLWADGTAKRRFLVLPGTSTIAYRAEGAWDLPQGTVLIKEFLLETRRGDPSSLRPLETRFLVRRSNGWDTFSYRWNDGADDAQLFNGGQIDFAITDASGQPATYTHWFPSQNECRRCHNDTAGGSLGLRTVQMNRDFDYGGVVNNQLAAFDHIGLFGGTLPADRSALPAMPMPLDPGAALDSRARSYLEGNCAHCHHPGGPTNRSIDLRYLTSFAATQTCNANPEAGDLGVSGAKIIVPGSHAQSVLWLRVSRRDNHGMPPIGSLAVDADGSALIAQWIDGLTACP